MSRRRTADGKEVKDYNFTEYENNLTGVTIYEEYIRKLSSLFKIMSKVLKEDKYFILNVMDIRKGDKFYPLHIDIVEELSDYFYLDDIIIWDRRNDYSNLRPIGYPYKFRINRIHEFLLIFINKKG